MVLPWMLCACVVHAWYVLCRLVTIFARASMQKTSMELASANVNGYVPYVLTCGVNVHVLRSLFATLCYVRAAMSVALRCFGLDQAP